MYGAVPAPVIVGYTREQAEVWAERLAQDDLAWVIEHEGRCIGEARLNWVNQQDRRALYAIGLQLPELLGRGLGTEVTRLVLAHAFTTVNLHRVGLRVLEYNHRAIRCYEKCGFRVEGVERESARVGDQWHNDVIMGVLASEVGDD